MFWDFRLLHFVFGLRPYLDICMSRDLNDLTPELHDIAMEWQGECNRQAKNGEKYIFVCTYRNDADQQAAFDCGASNCRPGQS